MQLNIPHFGPALVCRSAEGKWHTVVGVSQQPYRIPYDHSVLAEAVYRHFVPEASEGVRAVIHLRDGSSLTPEEAGGWSVSNRGAGGCTVRLTEYEADYIADIARACSDPVLLANASDLSQRLGRAQVERAAMLESWAKSIGGELVAGVVPEPAVLAGRGAILVLRLREAQGEAARLRAEAHAADLAYRATFSRLRAETLRGATLAGRYDLARKAGAGRALAVWSAVLGVRR